MRELQKDVEKGGRDGQEPRNYARIGRYLVKRIKKGGEMGSGHFVFDWGLVSKDCGRGEVNFQGKSKKGRGKNRERS